MPKRTGRPPPLPLFGQHRRRQGSSFGRWVSFGVRLLLAGALALLLCGFAWLLLARGTHGEEEEDDSAVEVSFQRRTATAGQQREEVQDEEPQRVAHATAVSGSKKVQTADDWFTKWAQKEKRQEQEVVRGGGKADEDNGREEAGRGVSAEDEHMKQGEETSSFPQPLSPCPYFVIINSTSLFVRWRHPSPQLSWSCELKVRPSLAQGRLTLVYEGEATAAEVLDLEPATEYKVVLTCSLVDAQPNEHEDKKDGDSSNDMNTKSKSTMMRPCSRQVITLGRKNLVANPSFEEKGPQRYVKYFDENYMKRDPESFPAHWHSMMTPAQLCTDRARSGKSSLCFSAPDKSNYQFGAAQLVFVNSSRLFHDERTPSGHKAEKGHDMDDEESNREEPRKTSYLMLSGWSAAKDVTGRSDGGYGLALKIRFADDAHAYGHKLMWRTDDHRWERECLVIESDQEVASVNLFLLFLDHAGTVWFDDIYLAAASSIDPEFEECPRERVQAAVHGCCPRRFTIRSTEPPEDPRGVSIATQLTIDRLPALRMMAQNWDGPISAAVFVMDPTQVEEVLYFRSTWEKLARHVDFHLVVSERNYAYKTLGLYPVNTLRNVALTLSRTDYAIVLDADFIPGPDAHALLSAMMPKLRTLASDSSGTAQEPVVWVIPTFEVEPGVPLPETRREMVEMAGEGLARQVHVDKWAPAHGPTNYSRWLRATEPYEIAFLPEYEPYMMLHRDSVPLYDERFIGYGYDKVAQGLELHEAGYRFYVLPEVFAIHYDHGVPKWRGKGDVMRSRVFQNFYAFMGEVELAYKLWPPLEHRRAREQVHEYDAELDAELIKSAFGTTKPPAPPS